MNSLGVRCVPQQFNSPFPVPVSVVVAIGTENHVDRRSRSTLMSITMGKRDLLKKQESFSVLLFLDIESCARDKDCCDETEGKKIIIPFQAVV